MAFNKKVQGIPKDNFFQRKKGPYSGRNFKITNQEFMLRVLTEKVDNMQEQVGIVSINMERIKRKC